jgi:paraquat-inducible protein A
MSASTDPPPDSAPEPNVVPGRDWRECPHCGLFCRLPPRLPGFAADCPRCGQSLWRMRRARIRLPLAYALAAAMFYVLALTAPFLEISAFGKFSLARLATGPVQLAGQGYSSIAALVFAVTLIAPGAKLGILITTLGGLNRLPRRFLIWLLRWYAPLAPWAMIDVYLLGFLVAYTRLTTVASVHLDTAVYALIGFMLSMSAAEANLDTEALWRALDPAGTQPLPAGPGRLVSCPDCSLVSHIPEDERCPRCHAHLTARKPEAIARAWALLLASAFLYVPANLLPFMDFTHLARTQDYTIMHGVFDLGEAGLWPLALLVFFASICIPLGKLLVLAYLLIATQCGWTQNLEARTRAYRVIDFIGRWSMIDVFMVSILVALLRFGVLTSVHADTGAVCFASVVVLTIFAVNAFDPRLMWDSAEETP